MDIIEYIVDLQPYVVETINFDLSDVKLVTMPPITQQIEITPTTEKQVIKPNENKYIDEVTVNAVTSDIDSNITSLNIRKGVSILGVEGNLEPDKPNQTKTVSPTESQQVIKADTGYELESVAVNAIPSNYVGSQVPREQEQTITPTTTNQVIPQSTYLEGQQTILGDENLVPQNIAQGVEIFGVVGTAQTATRDENETMYEMQEIDYMKFLNSEISYYDIPTSGEYQTQQTDVNQIINQVIGEEF